MGQLEGCQKIPKKISEVRREVIWWSKRYNWHKTIEKSCLSFTVWPHERSTLKKKWHEKAIFPVLGKLTHMGVMIYDEKCTFFTFIVIISYYRSCRWCTPAKTKQTRTQLSRRSQKQQKQQMSRSKPQKVVVLKNLKVSKELLAWVGIWTLAQCVSDTFSAQNVSDPTQFWKSYATNQF